MKFKFCILLLLVLSNLSAQWKYSSGKSQFDGKYRTSYVKGHGGEFPYTNPLFHINRFNNTSSINMYFADVGYFGCDNNSIHFKFSDDINIYEATGLSINKSNDIIFIQDLLGLTKYEFLKKLMESNQFHVRFTNDCFQKDFSFSLAKSGQAIRYVLGELYDELKFDYDNKIKLQKLKNVEIKKFYNYYISLSNHIATLSRDELIDFESNFNRDSVIIKIPVRQAQTKMIYNSQDIHIKDIKLESGDIIEVLNHSINGQLKVRCDNTIGYTFLPPKIIGNKYFEIIKLIRDFHDDMSLRLLE